MSEPILWKREAHTHAKHLVLQSYIEGWLPVMAQAEKESYRQRANGGRPRLLIVDGFAGPGRYLGGERGSPLILLDALCDHVAFPRLHDVQFIFLFIEHDRRRAEHLQEETARRGKLPPNVQVIVQPGAFEEVLAELVDQISPGKVLIPTFAFIDPFGYSHAPMELAGQLLDFPRTEALFFLPLTPVARFLGREGQDAAMFSLFGTTEWRQAIRLRGTERRQFLLELFEKQLLTQSRVQYVRSFQLRTQDGNDYRLVFATGNKKGLALMKTAMWSVDPTAGTSYAASTEHGQEVLFTPAPASVDTKPLLEELRLHFGTKAFSIEDAEAYTLFETPYRHDGHLKRLTLAPAERAGVLEAVKPEVRRRACTYPTGTRLRFTQ